MSVNRPKTEDYIELYITGIPNEMNDVSIDIGFWLADIR